jgi:predicted nucleotidyltransferase
MKIMHHFFEHPYEAIHLRELARTTTSSNYATKKIIDELRNQHLIIEKRQGNQRVLQPNVENPFFKFLKIAFSIKTIQDTHLLQHLEEQVPALSCIILYGSTAQGLDDKNSDIDLLIIGQKTSIDVTPYEKKSNREINLLMMKWSEWRHHSTQDKPFYREIIKNGIPLYGDIPVIE